MHEDRAKKLVESLATQNEEPSVGKSSAFDLLSLPPRSKKIGCTLGAAGIAIVGLVALSRSDKKVITTTGGSQDTTFYQDWSDDPTWSSMRTTDIKKAYTAIKDLRIVTCLENVGAAIAPLEAGPYLIRDNQGNKIMRMQFVRKLHLPDREQDPITPDTIEYEFACENIVDSPYTFGMPLEEIPQSNIEVKTRAEVQRMYGLYFKGEPFANLFFERNPDSHNLSAVGIYSLSEDSVIYSSDLPSERPAFTLNLNFIQDRSTRKYYDR